MTTSLSITVPDYRLFKRSVIVAVATLILLIAAFSAWKSVTEYRLTVQGAEQKTRGYARALKEHAERTFSEADTILLDTVDYVQSHGGLEKENSEHLRSFLLRHPRNIPQIGSVALVNRSGVLFAHSLDSPVKQTDVSDHDYFIHFRDNPADNTPYFSKPLKVNGEWRITLSRPVRSATGVFDGLVVVALEMKYFQEFYTSLDLGSRGKIVMVRRDGELLMTAPFKDTDYSIDFKKSHLIRTYLAQSPKGTYHIASGKALLGTDGRIISYDSLEHFPVVANANMGLDEVTGQWRSNTLLQAALSLLVSLALWLLAVVLLRQVRRIESAYRLQLEQQSEIAASAETWQSTFDAVGAAVWVMDLDRHVLRANKTTESIFGTRVDQVIGHRCCEIAHKNAAILKSCPFQKMLDTGLRASMQIKIDDRWYDVSVDPVTNDLDEITCAVHIVTDITHLKRTEDLTLESETRMRALLSAIPDAIFFKDAEGKWQLANHAGLELFCLQQIDYQGKTDLELSEMVPQRREELLYCHQSDEIAWGQQCLSRSEESVADGDGRSRIFDTVKIPLFKEDGSRHGMVIIGRDITAQMQMEMQLRQAQKMEAIGHLAGGIAHDFNNLLTPILGYAEMIAVRLHAGDPLATKVAGISAAAHKAKELTQQLLSFGRRQAVTTAVFDLNEVINSFHIVLSRTIRESIEINLRLDPEGAFVTADRLQLEQIILNLTVNAQDAVSGTGKISIKTCKVFMEGEDVRLHPGMAAGEYVLLSFHDNGCGMSSEVLAHIFEPFFTTKAAGHGTGLGLATVYGIVKQHNGYISVTSRENEGTTFSIYLPATTLVPLVKAGERAAVQSHDHRNHTVLVVEDNEMVREMVREMLEGHGYQVLTAADAGQAIEIASENTLRVDLLVSDVVMPGMSGPELYEQLITRMPDLGVVFISGYPMNPSIRGGTLEEEVSYLQKPFTAEALLERIRAIL